MVDWLVSWCLKVRLAISSTAFEGLERNMISVKSRYTYYNNTIRMSLGPFCQALER